MQAIALIDGNNFYAACEQNIDPSLSGRPVIVLSNNDGCIIARSPEARALGIPMGQPYFKSHYELKKLDVIVRSPNYALYGDMSQRLMSLLEKHCNLLEIYSIDEAFAQINRPTNYDLIPWARKLRTLIHRNLGLSISIGIGTSKVQAKLANHLAKNISTYAGIFDLNPSKNNKGWLEKVNVEQVWGVGQQMARWCRIRGINTAQELLNINKKELQSKFGVTSIRLLYELQGENCFSLKPLASAKQQTCVSRSFSRPITTIEELHQAISSYVVRASEKLRKQHQRAGAITIFVNTSPFAQSFYKQSATTQLNTPSNDTAVLLKASRILTKKIFRPYHLLIKAGVIMQKLQGTDHLQGNLLESYDNFKDIQRREQLMQTIDNLNQRYGNDTLKWATCISNQSWNMRRKNLGYASTTRIIALPIVHS